MPRKSEIEAISSAQLVAVASRILSNCPSRRFELACDTANHSAPTSASMANDIDGSIYTTALKQLKTDETKRPLSRSWPSSTESVASPTGVD
jgi:hypothetical protein